jgi:hypothetical protein
MVLQTAKRRTAVLATIVPKLFFVPQSRKTVLVTKSDDAPDQYEPMRISLPQCRLRHCPEGSMRRRLPRRSTLKFNQCSANSQNAHDGDGGNSTKTAVSCHSGNQSDDAPDEYEPMKFSVPHGSVHRCSEGSRLHGWRRIAHCSTLKDTHCSATSRKAHNGVEGNSAEIAFSCHRCKRK